MQGDIVPIGDKLYKHMNFSLAPTEDSERGAAFVAEAAKISFARAVVMVRECFIQCQDDPRIDLGLRWFDMERFGLGHFNN